LSFSLHLQGTRHTPRLSRVFALKNAEPAKMHAVWPPTLGTALFPRSRCQLSTELLTRSHCPQRPRRRDLLQRRSTAPLRRGAGIALQKGRPYEVLCGLSKERHGLEEGLYQQSVDHKMSCTPRMRLRHWYWGINNTTWGTACWSRVSGTSLDGSGRIRISVKPDAI